MALDTGAPRVPLTGLISAYRARLRPLLLLQGSPALVALVGLTCLLGPAGGPDLAGYRAAGDRAFDAADWSTAVACYQRVATLHALAPERLDRLARALHGAGRPGGADAIMRRLASEGHASAQFWLAKRLLARSPTRARVVRGRYHLEQVIKGDPANWEAGALLAAIHLSAGDHRRAERVLSAAVKVNPGLHLTLAQLYTAWVAVLRPGQRDIAADLTQRARQQASKAIEHLEPLYYKTETDRELLLGLISANTIAHEFEAALQLVERGETLQPGRMWSRKRARIYLAWSRAEAARTGGSAWRAVELLLQAFEHEAADSAVNRALEAVGRGASPAARRVVRALRARLSGGPADVPVQMVLGNIALAKGDHPAAAQAFRAAHRHQPAHPVVVNNLAWTLAHLKPAPLPEALALLDGLSEAARGKAEVRDTRAEILFRLGRWEAALPELMAALKATPRAPRLHRMLAVVYQQLEMPEVAAEHHQTAEAPPSNDGEGG